MGVWLVAGFLWLQTWNVSATEDAWGEATLSGVSDWQGVRESARKAALESVMSQLWDRRIAPKLLDGVDENTVRRIRKDLLARGDAFLVGLSSIQENRFSNSYTFRALFRMDVAGMLREAKRQLTQRPARVLHVHLGQAESWAAPVWERHAQPGLAVVVRREPLPEHCPVDFCLGVRSARYEEGFEATAELRTTVQETPPAKRGARPEPVSRTATESFSWVASRQSLLYQFLPPELSARLNLAPVVPVRLQATGGLNLATWTQILFLISRQEPEVVQVQTIAVLSGHVAGVLHVRPAGGSLDVLFKGLFLGPDVEVAVVKRPGFFELELRARPATPETGGAP